MRLKGKVDANQKAIVDELRKRGYSVAITSNLGNGFVDIVVGANGLNFLFEIKDMDQPPSKRKLTHDEVEFFNNWKGQANIIYSCEDAINIMNLNTPIF